MGKTYNYTRNTNVLYAHVFRLENSPIEFENLETYVNAAEAAEKRKDARTAREIIMSLPNNSGIDMEKAFTTAEYIQMVTDFVSRAFICLDICAIVAIHSGKNKEDTAKDNPHVHILTAERLVGITGFYDRSLNKR